MGSHPPSPWRLSLAGTQRQRNQADRSRKIEDIYPPSIFNCFYICLSIDHLYKYPHAPTVLSTKKLDQKVAYLWLSVNFLIIKQLQNTYNKNSTYLIGTKYLASKLASISLFRSIPVISRNPTSCDVIMEGLPSAEMSETHNNKAAVLAYPAAPQVNAQSFLQLALYPITLKVSRYSLSIYYMFYYVLPARSLLVLIHFIMCFWASQKILLWIFITRMVLIDLRWWWWIVLNSYLQFEEVFYKVQMERKVGIVPWPASSNRSPSEKSILNGISGTVCPGEILAMLGPSGSGKTTLLTALGGRLHGKLSGKITYNSQPFCGSIKRRTGFVAQDDVLYPHLTVTETLFFTALLRLPNTLTREEKVQHVENVISELGLTRCRSSMIGGPLFRGISGGEKKRVSIGQEMLINPSLLLLDEPTSGLDSTTAQRILTTIKRLASGGRTVVTTIHQPSSRLYHMFDKLVLLSEGYPIYYGPASAALEYFSSIGFSTSLPSVNPADLLLDLANGTYVPN